MLVDLELELQQFVQPESAVNISKGWIPDSGSGLEVRCISRRT